MTFSHIWWCLSQEKHYLSFKIQLKTRRSVNALELKGTYIISKLSHWSKMRLSWVIPADELFFLALKTEKPTGNLEQDLQSSAVIYRKMQYKGDTDSIMIFWNQYYTHISAEEKNGSWWQMVVENWQEQLRTEEGMGNVFFVKMLLCN